MLPLAPEPQGSDSPGAATVDADSSEWIIPVTTPVALVAMPMLSAREPSFQIGLLKPTLERAGFTVQNFSVHMYFGRWVGWRLQEALAQVWPCMVGEWVWSQAAFGVAPDDDERVAAYFEAYHDNLTHFCRGAGCSFETLRDVRDRIVPEFLRYMVDAVDWGRFGLVGCSIVFQQLCASIALSRALKERYPDLPAIFGGAAFEDDIASQVMLHCPSVDYIHCGDADVTLPEIVRRLYTGRSMHGMPGLWHRHTDGGQVAYAGRAENFAGLDETPTPDFDEYFYARTESGYPGSGVEGKLWLPIETARGCWWGQKHHCTFCGLNRSGMEFRSKSVDKVIEMLRGLSQHHGHVDFNAIDNIIEPAYIDALFDRLAAEKTDYRFHYDVRATLRRDQLRRMQKGGLFSVQAGVESLNTHVLTLMRKRLPAIRNVEFTKWCTYYGIENLYNILVGFAGETAGDYVEMAALMRTIVHLQPPYAIVKARADRGSPMFDHAEELGVVGLRPVRCYRYIYPDRFDYEKISYYYEHDAPLPDEAYADSFATVARWQARWRQRPRPYLRYRKLLGMILIEDGRWEEPFRYSYRDERAALYEFCDSAKKPEQIAAAFPGDWVDATLREWVDRRLLLHMDGRYLSLALPVNRDH